MTTPVVTQSTMSGSSAYAAGYEPTARPTGPVSGLSEDEARGFHTAFTLSFLGFLFIAIVAHYLVWQWRPWIPGSRGYPTRTAQTAPAVKAAPSALQVAYVSSTTR